MGKLSKHSTLLFICLSFQTSMSFANEVPPSLKCLWASYQNFKISADRRSIVFPNGSQLPYASRNPDVVPSPWHLTSIDQMFMTKYPFGFDQDSQGHRSYSVPKKKDELRASRYNPLFFKLYGNTEAQVTDDLVPVRWVDGTVVLFNQKYGAAAALRRTVRQLRELANSNPSLKKYLYAKLGGAFEWRHIAHSNNISTHSFGIAIDIAVKYSDYWQWYGVGNYRNRIPPIIAEVFENNGFVWGGKWYHYDTMHFEFRPELVMSRRSCEQIFHSYRD